MINKIRNHPILVAFICISLSIASLYSPFNSDIIFATILRLFLASILLLVISLLGGKESLKNKTGFGFSILKSLWLLILAFIINIGVFISGVIPEGIIIYELECLAFCLMVGLFEETLFRGILFNSILTKTGGKRSGVILAAIISALIFGALHIISYITTGEYSTIATIQAIGKTIQVSILGILWAAVYVKTKNIWAIAFVHAINDFILLQSSLLTESTEIVGEYVTTGENSMIFIYAYIFLIIVYAPALIPAFKIFKKLDIPEYGVFKK